MFQPVAIQSWVPAEAADTPPPTVAASAAAVATTSAPRVPSSGRRFRMLRRVRGTEGEAEHPVSAAAVMAYLRGFAWLFNVMTILRKFHGAPQRNVARIAPVTRPGSFGPAIPVLPG